MTEETKDKELTTMDEWFSAVFSEDDNEASKATEKDLSDAASVARESLERLTSRPT